MAADGGRHPLEDGCPPLWASGWGQDQYGVFVTFAVGRVEQRLRWIRPGSFLMGSPEGEEGRWSDEGPQHQVRITRGFWLGDTPVTQAMWEAVMGENPSEFKGDPQRPVETVSWEDCQRFREALDVHVPGLGARLPTEAEWEYACRARTTTARYSGVLEVNGEPASLDDIAWYWENSGKETHPVGQKLANAWGLHDTLGNVWEWCMDCADVTDGELGGYASEPQQDPSGPATGVGRVSRGGAWNNDAGHVRAAYRIAYPPGARNDDLGLRLARDQ